MIRIISIDRRVEIDKGGTQSDVSCKVILAAGPDVALNRVRFLLTPDEAEDLDLLTLKIESRIAELLASDYVAPEVAIQSTGEQAEGASG